MRITHADLHLWSRYRAPSWAQPLINQNNYPAIHAAINGRDRGRTEYATYHASNTCGLLRTMRRRMPITEALVTLTRSINPPADPQRSARCRRWLKQIDRRARLSTRATTTSS